MESRHDGDDEYGRMDCEGGWDGRCQRIEKTTNEGAQVGNVIVAVVSTVDKRQCATMVKVGGSCESGRATRRGKQR